MLLLLLRAGRGLLVRRDGVGAILGWRGVHVGELVHRADVLRVLGDLLVDLGDLLPGLLGRLREGLRAHGRREPAPLGLDLPADFRPLELEGRECLRQELGHGEARVPFPVRRDHVPRGPSGRGVDEHVLVGGLVVVPPGARVDVTGVELPVLVRPVQALHQPEALLLAGDHEGHLHDHGPGLRDLLLEGVDLPEPSRPVDLRQLLHPDHQDVLVVGAVEDTDLAGSREGAPDPPEVVVPALLGGRDTERADGETLGVHHPGDVPDDAALARGVEALDDEEDRPRASRAPVRVEPLLHLGEQVAPPVPERVGRVRVAVPAGRRRAVDAREVEAGADAQEVTGVGHPASHAAVLAVVVTHVSLPSLNGKVSEYGCTHTRRRAARVRRVLRRGPPGTPR